MAQWLRIRGYEAYALRGGVQAWIDGDGPVEPRGTDRAGAKATWTAEDDGALARKGDRPKGALNLDEKIELLGQLLPVDSRELIEPEILSWAIGHARQCLTARGDDPEEDKWLTDRSLFLFVVKPLIAAFWSEATGDTAGAVPWDDGSLARAWLEWRCPTDE